MTRKIILAVSFLHAFRAAMLCVSESPMNVTTIHALSWLVGSHRGILVTVYLTATMLALYREFHPLPVSRFTSLWFLPQFTIVLMAAIGAMLFSARGSYADGVPRPIPFIAADQIIYPVLAWIYYNAISRK